VFVKKIARESLFVTIKAKVIIGYGTLGLVVESNGKLTKCQIKKVLIMARRMCSVFLSSGRRNCQLVDVG
jgi:hypothetical protein